MKALELIKELKKCDPNSEVHFICGSSGISYEIYGASDDVLNEDSYLEGGELEDKDMGFKFVRLSGS